MGIGLMAWQKVAARYMTATNGKRWRYRDVCIVVARQNGKTHLMLPRIEMGLRAGQTILHTAQDRQIPRKTFVRDVIPGVLAAGLDVHIRRANGQEEVETSNGGRYRIVAPNASSRGESADLVIIDEVREQRDEELTDAILPTITARRDAQILYLSNAGDDGSEILNALRRRGTDGDRSLAYLEWSAHPDRPIDDREGWAEANPALGHTISMSQLEHFYRSRPAPSFETEHLCRWVSTLLPRLVSEEDWTAAAGDVGEPVRPVAAMAADPQGRRASVALAWAAEERVHVIDLADYQGAPVDLKAVFEKASPLLRKYGVRRISYDPRTDLDFARYWEKQAEPMRPMQYQAACQKFSEVVTSGMLRHGGDPELAADMGYTVRKDTTYGWIAIPSASDVRATTASFAAIRAVWLATNPAPPPPQVY
jgi:hypothetical protein